MENNSMVFDSDMPAIACSEAKKQNNWILDLFVGRVCALD